ncbi:MAG: L-serine ammonia-lyase, iron-sulfur-dependent, subunit alpha [Olsenella sp.]|jgi:L-cysteine desulfidase|nr:L-serine ammonia-lyase, iron-sulfur-dependent, subunit alpha [Olsenella sp.]MCI1289872.1 L-serine ammonia-lyase, iron-sulfur-dependent, subunit alpha [Olsenella sp.]
MNQDTYDNHVRILREELVCALGCTEPIAVAYAAALARAALPADPERLHVACSGNIIKNVKSVTVPNSGGMRGIEAAATLGAVGGNPTRDLEVLQSVDVDDIDRTRELVNAGFCDVELAEDVPNLYVRVVATGAGHTAVACIEERHTNVVELTLDGRPTTAAGKSASGEKSEATGSGADRSRLSLQSIWDFAHEVRLEDVDRLITNQIETNQAISREGLTNRWGANIGSTLLKSRPNDISCKARAAAAAGSDARMSGCAMPVVINCGSGNQGITCSQPVLEYAHDLWSSHEELVRAVVLSDLTAVHVKYFIGELSAFCGAVSASCGAGAGICMLRGGSFGQFEATIVNTLANVGGIVCDGAKPSCAAKICAAVDAAILGCDMALSDDNFLAGDGLVGANAEETIRSMGYVGRVGMHPTDVEILNIMIGKRDVDADA